MLTGPEIRGCVAGIGFCVVCKRVAGTFEGMWGDGIFWQQVEMIEKVETLLFCI